MSEALRHPQAVTKPRMSGAEILVRALEVQGVETIFGYPGGAIMPVYDALTGAKLDHILCRHEQGAALAADAYGRVTGKAGVCMATSGPGATNLVTGLANAMLDSVPMVAITGQVARPLMGTDAFQEVDIFGITLPIVKHSYLIKRTEDIAATIAEAFQIAESGRPGPVLIDLPKDVAVGEIEAPQFWRAEAEELACPDQASLAAAADLIAEARRPLLYLGGGVMIGKAVPAVRDFAARTGIPAVATLKGLGIMPPDDPHYLGMLGMHGTKAANLAVGECDLLICCGARFDDRATGKLDTFAERARVIHMDADPAEISKLRTADVGLHGDIAAALDALDVPDLDIDEWRAQAHAWREAHAFSYEAPGDLVYAPGLLNALSTAAGDRLIVTCDVGQHQMWAAQHCRFPRPEAHLTSGGLGTMGYGLPAGIGALFAEPDATVITVSGDGSIMMNIQELATLKRYGLPLKIVLLDNSALGMVRQWQELFFAENYSEVDLSDNPDFVDVAKAFGIDAFSIEKREEVPGAIDRLLKTEGAVLLHVKIDPAANVWPLVPPGKSNVEMIDGERR